MSGSSDHLYLSYTQDFGIRTEHYTEDGIGVFYLGSDQAKTLNLHRC